MAGLSHTPGPISAGQQFRAIAFLRWRLFANGFRRKGGAGELVARIIVFPVAVIFVLAPSVGAGFGGYAAVHYGKLDLLSVIFWGVTLLQIFVSINLSPPGLSFNPESLIRFPVSFPRYLTVRLFLGLLSASTIIGTCSMLAAALGVSIAEPSLAASAFTSAILLAITNMLFIRMIFAWIDRWLSTRRARELFTGVIIVFSIGIQWVNVTFNSGFNHRDPAAQQRKVAAAMHLYHATQTITNRFPAGLAGISILNMAHGAWLHACANLVAIALFAALFLAVFAWRIEREYRGESLSDAGSFARPQDPLVRPAASSAPALADPAGSFAAAVPPQRTHLPAALTASFYKEWIYVRRNTAQLYGMLAPIAMVFLFAGRMGNQFARSGWTFPSAIAYSVLGIAALAYNSFGLDAGGVQLYFLAPVRIRTILLAKNLFSFAIAALEAVIVYLVLCVVATRPPLLITISTLAWLAFAVLVNVTVGNIRSITAPKKMDPGKLSRQQASQLSALMSVGILLVVAAIGFGFIYLGNSLRLPWLPVAILTVLALAALAFYITGLNRLDQLAMRNRENMVEALAKAG